MNRRKLIAGLGALTAGAASAIGSSAYTAARLQGRGTNISVVNDSDGLIGLRPNPDVAGVDDSGGELTISLEDPGVNVNSIYQFGYFTNDGIDETPDRFSLQSTENPIGSAGDFDSAFLISNQTNSEKEVLVNFEPTSGDSDAGETVFVFQVHNSDGEVSRIVYPNQTMDPTGVLDPGEAFGVSFIVDATEGNLGDSFSANLRVTAEEDD